MSDFRCYYVYRRHLRVPPDWFLPLEAETFDGLVGGIVVAAKTTRQSAEASARAVFPARPWERIHLVAARNDRQRRHVVDLAERRCARDRCFEHLMTAILKGQPLRVEPRP